MPQRYRHIQSQLLDTLRTDFDLTEPEALLILDDLVMNLEVMAADLMPREDVHIDPARSPERILAAMAALAERLRSPVLTQIAADLQEADAASGQPLPDRAMEPLQRLVGGLRKVMPPVRRDHGD
ncbi:MAG: hypothetical protein GX657_13685 [Chloroflexi bacterium]|nr:hypothetical protein [Chloroflexota bacterium]